MLSETVYSFDIFDTLITRRTATPKGIFAVMQETLQSRSAAYPTQLVEDFYWVRIAAEELSRRYAKSEEITLIEIYKSLGQIISLSERQIHSLVSLEIETESDYVALIPHNVGWLESLKAGGARVVLISDTYFERKQLLTLFIAVKRPDLLNNLPLYLSSEQRIRKTSGRLFQRVCEKENIRPYNLIHIGDDRNSDFWVPRSLGIKVIRYGHPQLNSYERLYLSEFDRVSQLIAGASKRGPRDFGSPQEMIGYSIAGPILYLYVRWVLDMTLQHGVDRVYFISRDGQILKEIAERIRKEEHAGIDFVYLYGSRMAWHLPAIRRLGERDLDFLLLQRPVANLRIIAQRAGLRTQSIKSVIKKNWNLEVPPDRHLSEQELQQLRRVIKQDSQLSGMIEESAANARSLALKYLQQEGFMTCRRPAVVDLGWRGNLQDSLYSILQFESDESFRLLGLYFGLSERTPFTSLRNEKLTYLFDVYGEPNELIQRLGNFLELFCGADHGGVLGYEYSNGDCMPVLKYEHNYPLFEWGLPDFRKGVYTFLKQVQDLLDIPSREGKGIVRNLAKIIRKPDARFAETVGSMPFSSDPMEEFQCEFAPRLSLREAIYQSGNPYKYRWLEGAARRSSSIVRATIAGRNYLALIKRAFKQYTA